MYNNECIGSLRQVYTKPGSWFARLDYARRIGSDELMSKEAESKGRIWFMAGKIF